MIKLSLVQRVPDGDCYLPSSSQTLLNSCVLLSSGVFRYRVWTLLIDPFRSRRRSRCHRQQTGSSGIQHSSSQYLRSFCQSPSPINFLASMRTIVLDEARPILGEIVEEATMGNNHNLVF